MKKKKITRRSSTQVALDIIQNIRAELDALEARVTIQLRRGGSR